MKQLIERFKHHAFMAICIAACVIPLVAILLVGRSSAATWLWLLPCLAMHLIMMKMMGGKSCHGHEKKPDEKTRSSSTSSLEA